MTQNTSSTSLKSAARPTRAQLHWQNLEYAGFIHFNMSTFIGTGNHVPPGQDPSTFNPTDLDCRQWAQVARDAGMQMLVLTAKHHDGFCLWPSETTDYSVASSKWRDGRGDVVGEFVEACREAGLDVGLYLSPWDKQHEPVMDDYPDFYNRQLRELLDGRYGRITLMWLDGCGAQHLGRQAYVRWIETARELQPDMIFRRGWGPDARWGGKEAWSVGHPQWATIDTAKAEALFFDHEENERAGFAAYVRHGDPQGSDWMPAEADPPSYARNAWFWHPHATLPDLGPYDGFPTSVWNNAFLNRGLAPDRRGRIADDVHQALARCRANREALLTSRHEWASTTASDDRRTWLGDLGEPKRIGSLMLGEAIEQGQHVMRFTVELETPDGWQSVHEGQTIGRKTLVSFPAMTAQRVRLRLTSMSHTPQLSLVQAMPETVDVTAASIS